LKGVWEVVASGRLLVSGDGQRRKGGSRTDEKIVGRRVQVLEGVVELQRRATLLTVQRGRHLVLSELPVSPSARPVLRVR